MLSILILILSNHDIWYLLRDVHQQNIYEDVTLYVHCTWQFNFKFNGISKKNVNENLPQKDLFCSHK